MDEFLESFNEDGSFKFKIEAYFDEYEGVDRKIIHLIEDFEDMITMDSDAAMLYYADKYEGTISAYSLFIQARGV